MRKQLSIVLVEGDHLPRELSALLVGMGVWVKSTWSTGLEEAVTQTTPHLVVCGDPSQLPLLKRTIADHHPGTPLLLIADWDLTRARRAVSSGLVEDLIPDSLPAADIARRLETLAARRATRMPSRATLTPPTRAGIHPLLPVGAGREDRTPESRQDNPVPSRRPPPPPVRVMSPPSSAPPRLARSIAPQPSIAASAQSLAPMATSVYPQSGYPAQAYPAQAYPAQGYPAQAYSGQSYSGQNYPAQSYPAQAYSGVTQPQSPDSAPPIQMLTTTAGRPSRRPRSSGPGFTLGAALGVAASAAAFVGVIEFEHDLRRVASSSMAEVRTLVGQRETRLPQWLTAVAKYVPGGHGGAKPAAPAAPAQDPAPVAAARGATALELADLGTVETTAFGMSQAEVDALFKVEDANLASCEQMLVGWEAPLPMIEEDRPKQGAIHRRQAQAHLVAGEPMQALRDLCKSATIDPAGAGTETLANVYLSQRSLEHAETWAKRFLADNARSESGRELLGDIENQRGKVAEARAAWLAVLGIDASKVGTMREVARHYVQDATSAMGASDLSQAERKLRRALTLDPTNTSAALLLSRVLERQGLVAPSLAWAARARELAR